MVIDAIGLDKLIEKFDKLENVNKVIKPVIRRGTQLVQNTAKDEAPVDTGTLKGSISRDTFEVNDSVIGLVGTNVDYAPYQEFGTVNQKGKPFLRPAIRKHRKDIKKAIYKALQREMEALGK